MPLPPPVDLRPWFLTQDDLPAGPLDWPAFWSRPPMEASQPNAEPERASAPVELDVGCGRGLFLLNAALSRPERNFLGLELSYKEGRRAARRLQKRNLENARVLGGDARRFLRESIAPASVAAVHVYFPDPWWKRRHKKRRVFTADLVGELARILRPHGFLYIRTDVEDYFRLMCDLVERQCDFASLPIAADGPAGEAYLTSFERKARQAGSPIYVASWTRVTNSGQTL